MIPIGNDKDIKRIFITEDSTTDLFRLKKSLEKMGKTIVGTADSADETIRQVLKLVPDIVFIDIIIKGEKDGIFAAKEILKKLDIPIVFVSSNSSEDTVNRAMEVQPYGYFVKPIDSTQLRINLSSIESRIYLEQKIKEYQNELEVRVEARTLELHQTQTELEVQLVALQKCAKTESRLSHEWKVTFDAMEDSLWLLDKDNRILRANKASEKAFNCSSEKLIGKHCWEIVHGTNHPFPECPVVKAKKSLRRETMQLQMLEGWFEIVADPILESEDKYAGSVHIIRNITNRKRIEMELIESEERLKNVLEGSRLGYWDWDIVTGEVRRNKRWADMLNYTLEEIEYTVSQWSDLHHPDDREFAWKSIQDHLEGKTEFYKAEYRMRCKDGSYKWILDQAKIVSKDETGVPVRMSGTHIDITDRKKAEFLLVESQAKLSTALSNMSDAILICDVKGQIIDINNAFAIFNKFSNKEECQKTLEENPSIIEFILPNGELVSLGQKPINRALRGEKASNIEYNLRRKDTDETWAGGISFSPMCDRDDNIIGAVVTGRDITELRIAKDALVKKNVLLDTILNNTHVMEVYLDTDFNYIWVNSKYSETCQQDVSFFPGKNHFDIYPHPENQSIFQRVVDTGEPFFVEAKPFVFPDQPERGVTYWDWSLNPVFCEGIINGLIFSLVEVTDKIMAEKEKANIYAQLVQAQKMESIGQLAGGIAHDFNNMLTVIMGTANLMQLTLNHDDVGYREFTEIVNASERARDLTSKLLTFSRKDKLNVLNMEATQLVAGVVKMLERSIDKNIKIVTKLSEGIRLKVDRNQLEQGLLNICVNARDAMPDGGKLIIQCDEILIDENFARTKVDVGMGRFCVIQVSDTGTGMTDTVLRKCMEPFYTTKEQGKGTGLGMSVTHGIIQSHGGFMDLLSKPGEGTVVKLYIPVAEMAEDQESTITESYIKHASNTILVVDDEESILDISHRALTCFGYKVHKANGGVEALKIYREHMNEISLVLLDMIMPDMSGTEVFKELKSLNSEVRIVIISGYSTDGIAEKLVSEGAYAFIQKPFTVSALLKIIQEVSP